MAVLLSLVRGFLALPAAVLARAALSRRREELADAAAVQFTRDPGSLRRALEKLRAGQVPLRGGNLTVEGLWIDDPWRLLPRRWIDGLMATHPPIEDRIAWLLNLEGATGVGDSAAP